MTARASGTYVGAAMAAVVDDGDGGGRRDAEPSGTRQRGRAHTISCWPRAVELAGQIAECLSIRLAFKEIYVPGSAASKDPLLPPKRAIAGAQTLVRTGRPLTPRISERKRPARFARALGEQRAVCQSEGSKPNH